MMKMLVLWTAVFVEVWEVCRSYNFEVSLSLFTFANSQVLDVASENTLLYSPSIELTP